MGKEKQKRTAKGLATTEGSERKCYHGTRGFVAAFSIGWWQKRVQEETKIQLLLPDLGGEVAFGRTVRKPFLLQVPCMQALAAPYAHNQPGVRRQEAVLRRKSCHPKWWKDRVGSSVVPHKFQLGEGRR